MNTAADLISRYRLLPHPEGGYYRETYRSSETITAPALPHRFGGSRHFSTAIYFLLERGHFSAFHRIKSDECWHFYAGQTLLVHIVHTNGELQTVALGSTDQQALQAMIVKKIPSNTKPYVPSTRKNFGLQVESYHRRHYR